MQQRDINDDKIKTVIEVKTMSNNKLITIPDEFKEIVVRGDKLKLDKNDMIYGNSIDNGDDTFLIYFCCDCHFGARYRLQIENYIDNTKDKEYITLDAGDFEDDILYCFSKYISGFDSYDSFNPLKENCMYYVYRDLESLILELKQQNASSRKIKYTQFLLWYFRDYKMFSCSQTDRYLNITGY